MYTIPGLRRSLQSLGVGSSYGPLPPVHPELAAPDGVAGFKWEQGVPTGSVRIQEERPTVVSLGVRESPVILDCYSTTVGGAMSIALQVLTHIEMGTPIGPTLRPEGRGYVARIRCEMVIRDA